MWSILLALIGAMLFHQFYWRRRKLPHGPLPLPVFGNVLSFRNGQLESSLKKWRAEYGDLHTIWLGTMPVVTLHDAPTIYQTFLKNGAAYEDRAVMAAMEYVDKGNYGLGFASGELWREHRRFAIKVLRDFGLGKNLMQERVLNDVSALIQDIELNIKEKHGQSTIVDHLAKAVGSIINSLLLGYRFDETNIDEFRRIKGSMTRFMQRLNSPSMKILENSIPFFKHFPILKSTFDSFVREAGEMERYLLDKIQKHKNEIDFESLEAPLDYCDAFLREQNRLDRAGITDHTFSDKQLYASCHSMWIAGQETTANTLSWMCVYILNHPRVQEMIHQELNSVIGSDRLVTMEDKNGLNYVNAVVAETQRVCNLLPINLLHRTTKQVEIHGHVIPQNTVIVNQLSSVLGDDKHFTNPDVFIPERFLDREGKFFSPPELMPFGVGKRACLGEGLARMELYLFTANIFNQFKMKPEGDQPPKMDRIPGLVVGPHRFNCRFEKRIAR